MGRQKSVTVGDKEYTARELSMKEIRDWMADAEAKTGDELIDLGDVLFDDVRVDDLVFITNASADELDTMTPSELRQIADACKEANADFFAMAQRLNPVFEQVLAAAKSNSLSEQ